MFNFLAKLQTEVGKIHNIPLAGLAKLLRTVAGDTVTGRGLVLEAWDLTHWEIFESTAAGGLKRLDPQPLKASGGMLLLIKSAAGIMGGALIAKYWKAASTAEYETSSKKPQEFAGLYQVNGSHISNLTTNMVLRVPGKDGNEVVQHQPMGEFTLRERVSADGQQEILAGMFVNTNSMSPRGHIMTLAAFRKGRTITLG